MIVRLVLPWGGRRAPGLRHGQIYIPRAWIVSYINTYPGEMANILGPGRYTKYGISRLLLFSCMSAHDDIRRRNTVSENVAKRIKVWSSNVARAGWFIGYSGSPNIFTEMYSWTPIRGINSD